MRERLGCGARDLCHVPRRGISAHSYMRQAQAQAVTSSWAFRCRRDSRCSGRSLRLSLGVPPSCCAGRNHRRAYPVKPAAPRDRAACPGQCSGAADQTPQRKLHWAHTPERGRFTPEQSSPRLPFASLVAEECFDRHCCFDRPRHHEQVSVIDHLQSGIWNEPRQNATVDRRHQRIIPSHQHQGRLP